MERFETITCRRVNRKKIGYPAVFVLFMSTFPAIIKVVFMSLRSTLKYSLVAGLGLALAGVGVLVGAYLYVSKSLPQIDTLADYRPPIITQVFSDDGQVIAEFYRERRIVVPVSRMPIV